MSAAKKNPVTAGPVTAGPVGSRRVRENPVKALIALVVSAVLLRRLAARSNTQVHRINQR
ncbi:hypothetical protein ACIBCM_30710 [Streptomyces sp. NPDC051018]|uniref:hypothetical protein n=1 Tax=Streptomyces sp. NPDC051018 TaxID=3365639 RepID=UPI0037A422E9